MREKSYGPYLKSSLETAYIRGLKKNAAEYPEYKPGDPVPQGNTTGLTKLDPVTASTHTRTLAVRSLLPRIP